MATTHGTDLQGTTGDPSPAAGLAIDPEVTFSALRVSTIAAFDFFHVSVTTEMQKLDEVFVEMINRVGALHDEAGITRPGPLLVRWYTGENGLCTMEVGMAVPDGTPSHKEALCIRLAPFRCASVLVCGPMRHVTEGYDVLNRAIERTGLTGGPEYRECHYYHEGDDSPNNVVRIMRGISG